MTARDRLMSARAGLMSALEGQMSVLSVDWDDLETKQRTYWTAYMLQVLEPFIGDDDWWELERKLSQGEWQPAVLGNG